MLQPLKRAAQAAGLGAGASALLPEEAEGAWQPWQKGMDYTSWMKELEHIFKNQKFTEPFQSSDMLHPSVAERMAKAEQADIVPEQVLLSPKHLSHVYSRRVIDNHYPVKQLVETYGEAFGNPIAQASPQREKLSVLTSLRKGKDTGTLFPFHLEKENAVLHSGMLKNAEQINSIRKNGEALLEGRSKHLSGVSEKPSEAYPSFSLAGEPTTIRSYSEFSDVGKAPIESSVPESIHRRNALIPLALGSGLALTPDEAFGWGPGGLRTSDLRPGDAAPQRTAELRPSDIGGNITADLRLSGSLPSGDSAFLGEMSRQFGLGSRGVLEGLGQGLTLGLGNPGKGLSDLMGLPLPQNETEQGRVGLNSALAGVAGSGLLGRTKGGLCPTDAKVLVAFAQREPTSRSSARRGALGRRVREAAPDSRSEAEGLGRPTDRRPEGP